MIVPLVEEVGQVEAEVEMVGVFKALIVELPLPPLALGVGRGGEGVTEVQGVEEALLHPDPDLEGERVIVEDTVPELAGVSVGV